MENCKVLSDYSFFVEKIKRKINEGKSIKTAVEEAINESIKEGILGKFLLDHKAEVKDMCLTEYNEKEFMKSLAKEEREEGIKEGVLKGERNMIVSLVKDGTITALKGAEKLGISLSQMNMMLL